MTSHRDGTLCAATFDNVSVSSGNLATGAAPPFISDLRRHSGDVIELIIHGQPGHTYKVEASTNLLHWTPLATPLNTTGSFTLIDPDAPNHPVRFYRVILER